MEKNDDKTYHGWSNYETWAVALWLDNERSSYEYWREEAARIRSSEQLARQLQSHIEEEGNPLAGTATLYADLLSASLSSVDWFEIAEHLMPEDEPTLIHAYTRQNAIDDGFHVDVSGVAAEAGIKYPTAITRTAWGLYVEVPDGVEGQDEDGRLSDILWMFRAAAKRGSAEIDFSLYVRNDNRKPRLVALKAVCAPGDNSEPVITIMLPDED